MIRCGALLLPLAGLLGCTTPLDLGERRYREGDRLGALEVWRAVPASSPYYESVRKRTTDVQAEFHQLVVRYKKRARYYETKGRLAESVLNYRLALKLQPDDAETLDHVQSLSRSLAERKLHAHLSYRDAFEAGNLGEARTQLTALRRADPFDPELESDERALEMAFRDHIDGLLARGRRGFSSGDHGRAERAFREVLELEPQNESARGHLSFITTIREQERSGLPVAAAANPQREPVEVHATDVEIRAEGAHQNALIAAGRGDPYRAIQHELEAQRANPRHAASSRHLARLRGQLGPQVDELIEQGRLRFRDEELEAALDQWRRALLIDPRNERATEYVARAERMLENLEQLRSEPLPQVGEP